MGKCWLPAFSLFHKVFPRIDEIRLWQKVVCKCFNSLPNGKIFDWSKLTAFADDEIYIAEMMISLSDWGENIVGKRENSVYQHFLLFPQCFQKLSLPEVLKVGIVW